MKRNALICLFIGIMLLMWVGCDTGSASSADSNTNNTGIANGNGNDGNDNNGENNNNNDDENGDNNGNDNEENNGDNGNGNSSSELFPAPTNFRVVSTTSSSVSLTWDEVSGAYCYIIGYGSSTGNAASEFSYTNNITISNLDSNTEYFFRVTALNENYDRGTSSSYIYGTTSAEELLPAPTNFRVVSTATDSISLSWDAVNGEFFYYAIQYWVSGSSQDSKEKYCYSDQTSITVSNLNSATTYCIKISTINYDNDYGYWSSNIYGTTQSSSSGGSSGNGGSSGGSISNNDNSILENVEREDYESCEPKISRIQLTDNKRGVKIAISAGYDDCVFILYRSNMGMYDLSSYKKVGTKPKSNNTWIEDYDIEFEKGNTYYYIVVAADSATSKWGVFSAKGMKYVCEDPEITYSTTATRWVSIDYSDTVNKYTKGSTTKSISAGTHAIEACKDIDGDYYLITDGYEFLAGCKYTVDLIYGDITGPTIRGTKEFSYD